MNLTFFRCAMAAGAKVLLEYLLERYHAGYVSPDKALGKRCCTRIAAVLTY